jgi:hypothetical protein
LGAADLFGRPFSFLRQCPRHHLAPVDGDADVRCGPVPDRISGGTENWRKPQGFCCFALLLPDLIMPNWSLPDSCRFMPDLHPFSVPLLVEAVARHA